MNEAAQSINIRVNFHGFDVQYTIRSDDTVKRLTECIPKIIESLEQLGATPQGKNGPTAPTPQPPTTERPVCQACNKSDAMELIQFQKNGDTRSAWKCQSCVKWHYSP
jgi:hypothetical protein